MLNELLILIAKLDDQQYLLIKHIILNCSKKGLLKFKDKQNIFDTSTETPLYLIRKTCLSLFDHPMVLNKTGVRCVVRPLSVFCPDTSKELEVYLSDVLVKHLSELRSAIDSGQLERLRLLIDEVAMNVYLSIHGTIELSEQEVRLLVLDAQTTRFSNIIERKLKPSLNSINKILGKNTSYLRTRIEDKPFVRISIL